MKHVVVLGAQGKMGSGIALLALLNMAWRGDGVLTLLDVNPEGFSDLKKYLKTQVKREAEKSINSLRKKFEANESLIDNKDMVDAFVEEALDRVRFVTNVEECKGASHVFEAIVEDVEIKAKLFKEIARVASNAYFLTNTSSIPIHILSEKSGLKNQLMGFHFYNPPPVQKLVEIILPDGENQALREVAENLKAAFGKTLVYSRDIAGFIGNGYFICEIKFACDTVRALTNEMTEVEAISIVNRVTQDFLLRPMGIFQLIDYVGIDVAILISKVMSDNLSINFVDPLLLKMLEKGIKGGQYPDGNQKDGFFKYEKGKIIQVYDRKATEYKTYERSDKLGTLPADYIPWKMLIKDSDQEQKIDRYFERLALTNTLESKISFQFLKNLREICDGLVKDNVAHDLKDVETVLRLGFYHLYLPKKSYFKRLTGELKL